MPKYIGAKIYRYDDPPEKVTMWKKVKNKFRRKQTLKVYKALNKRGESQHQGYRWPLPDEFGNTPGEWLEEPNVTPVLCRSGLHGWLTLAIAKRQAPGYFIYEMELEDGIVKDTEKAAGRRARLLKLVVDDQGNAPMKMQDLVWQ